MLRGPLLWGRCRCGRRSGASVGAGIGEDVGAEVGGHVGVVFGGDVGAEICGLGVSSRGRRQRSFVQLFELARVAAGFI